MSRPKLSAASVDDALEEIVELVPRVRVLHGELRVRVVEDRRDGFPTQSLGGGGSVGSSDPVGGLVVSGRLADEVSLALAHLVGSVQRARRELESAESAGMRVKPPVEAPAQDVDEVWCRSHARANLFEPRGEKGRGRECRWCDDFRRAEGRLPPVVLLCWRGEGRRIDRKTIEDAYQREAAAIRPRKGRKR